MKIGVSRTLQPLVVCLCLRRRSPGAGFGVGLVVTGCPRLKLQLRPSSAYLSFIIACCRKWLKGFPVLAVVEAVVAVVVVVLPCVVVVVVAVVIG